MHPDFSRDIHCILGLPFDAITMPEAVQHIRDASANRSPCFLSTPNLNFLIACQSDSAFRNSVINSDLSIADGMPIVWMAKLLGIPIHERIAGSDLFQQLRTASTAPLSVYFFGGTEGVAETACQQLNKESSGILCVGFESPGFGSVQEMSNRESIHKINLSGADFLLVSLGAKKGQAWIEHNRAKINVPVISHLGAVINFVAGNVERAPVWVQRSGLEWLWRIKEEPKLWRRYTSDGLILIRLLFSRVFPYAFFIYWHRPRSIQSDSAAIELLDVGNEILIRLRGIWIQENLAPLRECFSNLLIADNNVRIDFEHVSYVDSAFIGLLLLFRNRQQQGKRLSVINLRKNIRRIFHYTCADYVIDMQ